MLRLKQILHSAFKRLLAVRGSGEGRLLIAMQSFSFASELRLSATMLAATAYVPLHVLAVDTSSILHSTPTAGLNMCLHVLRMSWVDISYFQGCYNFHVPQDSHNILIVANRKCREKIQTEQALAYQRKHANGTHCFWDIQNSIGIAEPWIIALVHAPCIFQLVKAWIGAHRIKDEI